MSAGPVIGFAPLFAVIGPFTEFVIPRVVGTCIAPERGVDASHLRYFAASCVNTPMGNMDHMTLVSPTNGEVGKLDGMIIDPWERHVCYYVVESWRGYQTKRYLLPATPARLDSDRKALRVDVEPEDLSAFPQLNPELYPQMSADDLIEALFSPRAASRPS